MASDQKSGDANDREVIESNVRRIVGIAALRRVHRLIGEREETDRALRNFVAPIAAFVMILVAVLIWTYGSPRIDNKPAAGPLPECSPPRNDNITI
jgi:hypothetical protein